MFQIRRLYFSNQLTAIHKVIIKRRHGLLIKDW